MEKFNVVNRRAQWLCLLLLGCSLSVIAQTQEERTKYVLLNDYYKDKDYKKAIEPLDWFLKNSPKFHKNIYIKGSKLYHKLAEQTQDAQLKMTYQDKALKIYDLRIQHFGEEAKVLKQKGYYAPYYWSQRPDKAEELYTLYKKIIQLHGSNTYSQVISNYMYMVFQKYQKEQLKGPEVIEVYDQLTKIIEDNLTKAPKEWQETKKYVDNIFTKIAVMKRKDGKEPLLNCAFIEKYYMPQYNENPNDIKIIKKIISYLILVRRQDPTAPCGNNATFVQLNEKLFNEAPTYEGGLLMIKLYQKLGDKQKVEELTYKLPELAIVNENKAQAKLKVARYESKKGKYTKARRLAQEAAQLNPGKATEAYNFIAGLYYSSGKICTDKNPVLARAVYVAAYHMYKKAGNASGMAKAKAQCPELTTAFSYNYKDGQLITVGCWIGGKVKLITR
ncbi:MAG TPA: hypothetical protein DCS93_00025 [Microscillaceae bacterium]|nr:hypothetical protein [Microscillaceae bacterium]